MLFPWGSVHGLKHRNWRRRGHCFPHGRSLVLPPGLGFLPKNGAESWSSTPRPRRAPLTPTVWSHGLGQLSAWLPLHDIDLELGGLAVLEGSNRLPGFRTMHGTYARNAERVAYLPDPETGRGG